MLDHRKRVNISNIAYAVYSVEKYKWISSAPFVLLAEVIVRMYTNVDESGMIELLSQAPSK